MRERNVEIALAQIKIVPKRGDLQVNADLLMSLLEDLAPQRPDVVITPECFLDGYIAREDQGSRYLLRRPRDVSLYAGGCGMGTPESRLGDTWLHTA